jgi:hypothetical protein
MHCKMLGECLIQNLIAKLLHAIITSLIWCEEEVSHTRLIRCKFVQQVSLIIHLSLAALAA